MNNKRICLISPGHLSCNPRLFKEASALHEAGFQVRVVTGNYSLEARRLDQMLEASVPCPWHKVNAKTGLSRVQDKIIQRITRSLFKKIRNSSLKLAIQAHSSVTPGLAKIAAAEPAALYIAHYIAALPAAAQAAQKHNAQFGFDAEDYHVGELTDTPVNRAEIVTRDFIERTLLPQCTHRTASSPLIAKAYAERYGVTMEPILNVFPLCEAPDRTERKIERSEERTRDTPFTLYWFSQTIGPGRGLETILQIMAKVRLPTQLVLRGTTSSAPGFLESFFQLAQGLGIAQQIQILPAAAPDQMAKLASPYDIGISVEQNQPCNRAICLTNKIFTYLLAGIPVLLSRTPAQEQLAKDLDEAALLVDLNNLEETSHKLERFLSDPATLTAARCKAWQLSKERYNWDIEKQRFLSLVEKNLVGKTHGI